jgi:CelD/BcsL family acetyltransferase involved in cellulose biosynthesis
MTLAAAIESRTAGAPAWSQITRISRIEIFDEPGQAEAIWRGLEDLQHFSTPFQRFDFLRPWQQLVGERAGYRPFIVVAFDDERRPLVLLPLTIGESFGSRIASFMGGKHATFNMGLWDRDFAKVATRADLEAVFSAIRERAAVDALAFFQQPLKWQDQPNPLALLPHQPSVNDCPLMTISPEAAPTDRISHSLRRRLGSKERKLKNLAGYRYCVAGDDGEIKRLLDAFFRIKPQRMAAQKLPNVFEEAGVENFIREACMTRLANGGRVIEIHALECDDEVIAIFAGVADGRRFSMMFNTYTISQNSRYSPGLILVRNIIDHYAERDYRILDLGVGPDDYKRHFCKNSEPIFDCFVSLSLRGRIATAAMSGVNRIKHLVKHTPALLPTARRLRNALR